MAVGQPVAWFHERHHPSMEGKVLRPKAWNVNGSLVDGPSEEHVGSIKGGSCVQGFLAPARDCGPSGGLASPEHCQQSEAVQPGVCDAA